MDRKIVKKVETDASGYPGAMVAGVTDHVWEIGDILKLLDEPS